MTIEKAFGTVIGDLRRKVKISQTELGELAGVSRQSVSEIERGIAGPRLPVVFRLASSLQVAPDELVRRTSIVYRDQREE